MRAFKHIFSLILITIFCSISAFAQGQGAPESMNYQAVIRDGSGNVLASQAVSLRIKILQGSASGNSVYIETFTPTTNAYGSIAIQIGTGSVITGTFNTIDWGANSYFVETAVDISGGTNYSVISTTQLMSVPYALYAKTAGSSPADNDWTESGSNIYRSSGNVGVGNNSPQSALHLGSNSNLAYNYGTTLTISGSGNTPSSGGTSRIFFENTSNNSNKIAAFSYGGNLLNIGALTNSGSAWNGWMMSLNVDNKIVTVKNTLKVEDSLEVTGKSIFSNLSGTGDRMVVANSSGTLSTQAIPSDGASSINDLNDALVENNSLFIGNDPSSTTNSASYNLSLGTGALSNITTADKNTAVGTDALKNHTEGSENVALGYVALRDNTIGQWNVAVGKGALLSSSSGGSRNIAIGTQALSELNGNVAALNTSVGSNNIAIGHKAGEDQASGGASLITGTKNILIGHHVSASSSNAENEIVIGAEALGSGNNTVTLGNSSIANVKTSGTITAGAITIPNTDGSNGQVLSTNGNGTLSWTSPSGSSSPWTESGSDIYRTSGNVGIGTTSPIKPLSVEFDDGLSNGEHILANFTRTSPTSYVGGLYLGYFADGSNETAGILRSTGGLPLYIGTNTYKKLLTLNGAKLGINNVSPVYTLDIDGDINLTGSLRVNGVAQTFGGSSSPWTESGSNIYRSSGIVGMGTTSPLNNLDVFSSASTTVSFSNTSGGSRILLGNQDTGGSNNPAVIQGVNGELYFGGGDSWVGGGNHDINMIVSDYGNVIIGNEYSTVSNGLWNNSTAQLVLGGTHNTAFNTGTKAKLVITGYDNDGSTIYPIYLEDENGNKDHYIKNAPSQSGSPTAYYRGNVGIGTETPNAKLEVSGTARITDLAGTGDRMVVADSDGDLSTQAIPSGSSSPWTESASDIYRSSGNVGIGTNSPNSLLEISNENNSSVTPLLALVNNDANNNYTGIRLMEGSSYNYGFSIMYDDNGTFGTSNALTLLRHDNSSSGVPFMTALRSNGRVGFGTTTPNSLVEIKTENSSSIDPTNHVTEALRLVAEYANDWAGNPHEGGVGVKFMLDNQNGNYWPTGEINFIGENSDNNEGHGGFQFKVNNNTAGGGGNDESTASSNTTAMVINHDGKVGIGTTSPTTNLHVEGSILVDAYSGGSGSKGIFFRDGFVNSNNYNSSILVYDHNSSGSTPDGLSVNGYDGVSFSTGSNSRNERMRISSDGNIGIGTTSPSYPLHITKSVNQPSGTNYGIIYKTSGYNSTGFIGPTNVNLTYTNISDPISLFCSNYVAGYGMVVTSDKRIKDIIGISDSKKDLSKLLSLEVTDYKMKDKVQYGEKVTKKLIAQQVKEVLPEAVSLQTEFIPNIYKLTTIKEGIINLENDLKKGDKVKLYFDENEEIVEVVSATKNSFKLNSKKEGQVFVYGKQVNDFHVLDYDAVSMLNVSATQELYKIVTNQQKIIDSLNTQIVTQEKLYQKNQENLNNRLQVLESLLTKPISQAKEKNQ